MVEPWSKFFWSDYDADEGLRVCSLSAQGLWMRMLCLMARSTPKGELRIGGEPCTISDLSRSVGESEETVSDLLGELKKRGVFSVTRAGVIFSRRMRKEGEISRKRSKSGKKGGIATHSNKRQNQICYSKTAANELAKLKPQKPEARYTNTNVLEAGASERTVFKDGLRVLQAISGKKESECRSIIGKWINKSSVPDAVVLAMIDEAERSGVVDPIAWITKQISRRTGLSTSVDDPDHKIIFDAWDDMARKNGLPVIQGVAPRRTDNLNQILSKFSRDKVLHAISCIPSSEFLLGKSGWRISIDDFLKPDTFLKVLEGGFSDGRSSAGCLSQEQQRARMNIFVERGVWHPTWGGKPGESNCSVSVEIQREFSNQEVML